jgi:hypothetical protein
MEGVAVAGGAKKRLSRDHREESGGFARLAEILIDATEFSRAAGASSMAKVPDRAVRDPRRLVRIAARGMITAPIASAAS